MLKHIWWKILGTISVLVYSIGEQSHFYQAIILQDRISDNYFSVIAFGHENGQATIQKG